MGHKSAGLPDPFDVADPDFILQVWPQDKSAK